MESGVIMENPESIHIEPDVEIAYSYRGKRQDYRGYFYRGKLPYRDEFKYFRQ